MDALPDEQPEQPAPDGAAKGVEYLTAPRGVPDDLTRIQGISPQMQSRLNELGIFHYWQLAELTPEDVARIEDGLGVKGRIVRDDWAGQARALNEDVAAV